MSTHPQERLSAFLDGELPPDERAQVQQHLATCDACAQELSELALVDRMGRELEVTAPEGYFETLPSRLRPRLRAAKRRSLPPWVLALAAVALMGVLIPVVWQRHPLEAPAPAAARVEPQARQAEPPVPSAMPTQAAPPLQKSADETTRAARAPAAVELPFAPPPPRPAPTGAPPEKPDLQETLDATASPSQPARELQQAPPTTLGGEAFRRGLGLSRSVRDQAPGPAPTPSSTTASGRAAPPPAAPPVAAPAQAPAGVVTTTTGGTGALAPAKETVEADAEAAPPANRREDARKDAFAKEEQPRLEDKRRKTAASNADAFSQIASRAVATAADARRQRRAWREFADLHPHDALADEARARAVEAASLAYRLSHESSDRKTLEDDVRAYLQRSDAAHKARVRALEPGLE